MSENSKIEWCDHTFNPWEGCTKVSPGCAHCYAETRNARFGGGTAPNWGPGKPRRRTSKENWKQPVRWHRHLAGEIDGVARCSGCGHISDDPRTLSGCKGYCYDSSGNSCDALPCPKCGKVHYWCGAFLKPERPRVFCASLADFLDPEVPVEWLTDLLDLIRKTPHLDWLLLTKRPESWYARVVLAFMHSARTDRPQLSNWLAAWMGTEHCEWPNGHASEPPANVWIGTSVEDQRRADERIPALLEIPARVRFLSCEPLLGPVNLDFGHPKHRTAKNYHTEIHWVICGGESGREARPMQSAWAEDLRDQCVASKVPFFFKQWGEWLPLGYSEAFPRRVFAADGSDREYGEDFDGPVNGEALENFCKVGKKAAGRLLGGREWSEFPEVAETPAASQRAPSTS